MNQTLEPGQVVGLAVAALFWLCAIVFLFRYKFYLKHRDLVLMVIAAVIAGVISIVTIAPQAVEIGLLLSPAGVGVGGVLILGVGVCRKQIRPWNIWFKFYMLLAASFSPPVALFFWKAAGAGINDWKGSFEFKWYYCLDSEEAFVVIFPVLIFNSIVIGIAIFWNSLRRRSFAPLFASSLNGLICLWSTLYTLYIGGSVFGRFDKCPAWGPGVMVIGFILLTIRFRRELTEPATPFVWGYLAWGVGYIGSLALKIPLAKEFYESLPDQQPMGCFIVTASAQGHPWIVKSQFDEGCGYRVNSQLVTYRLFEAYLVSRWPRAHRVLRLVYNRLGPMVARQIQGPFLADIIYMILKPGEWGIRLLTLRK